MSPDFDAFWSAAGEKMRLRADPKRVTYRYWAKACGVAGSAEKLLACLRAYMAKDPDFPRTGGPSLTRWLRDGKYEHWLALATPAPRLTYQGPPEVLEILAQTMHSRDVAVVWLARCQFADHAVLAPPTAYAVLSREPALPAHGWQVARL